MKRGTTWCWSRTTNRPCTKTPSKPSWSHEAFPPYSKRRAYEARQSHQTIEKSRGRVEVRTLTSTTVGLDTCDWPGAKQFLRLQRRITRDGVTRTTTCYAVTSLSRERADAQRLLELWRGRWGIENKGFWVRDVVFGEDASRIRKGRAPHALSVFRNSAITLLRALKTVNLTAALREHALKLDLLLQRLGIM